MNKKNEKYRKKMKAMWYIKVIFKIKNKYSSKEKINILLIGYKM